MAKIVSVGSRQHFVGQHFPASIDPGPHHVARPHVVSHEFKDVDTTRHQAERFISLGSEAKACAVNAQTSCVQMRTRWRVSYACHGQAYSFAQAALKARCWPLQCGAEADFAR